DLLGDVDQLHRLGRALEHGADGVVQVALALLAARATGLAPARTLRAAGAAASTALRPAGTTTSRRPTGAAPHGAAGGRKLGLDLGELVRQRVAPRRERRDRALLLLEHAAQVVERETGSRIPTALASTH